MAIFRDDFRVSFSVELGWKIAATLLLGGMFAHWAWVFFAPRSEVVIPTHQVTSVVPGNNLFGIAAVSSVAVAALPNIRLVGVFAGKPRFAIFELDGKRQVAASLGDEIADSGKLISVASDTVVIERGGVQQKVSLLGSAAAVKSATAANVPIIPLPVVAPPLAVPVVTPAQSAAALEANAATDMGHRPQIQQQIMRGRHGF